MHPDTRKCPLQNHLQGAFFCEISIEMDYLLSETADFPQEVLVDDLAFSTVDHDDFFIVQTRQCAYVGRGSNFR